MFTATPIEDFDDVERRLKDVPVKKERRAHHDECMTYEEHHDTCRENFATLKEYMCLKLKPINLKTDSLEKGHDTMRNWLVALVVILLSGGVWTAFASLNTSAVSKEVGHVKSEQDELKADLTKRIDKVETGISKQLEQNKIELNSKIDKEIQRVIDEVRKLHEHDSDKREY